MMAAPSTTGPGKKTKTTLRFGLIAFAVLAAIGALVILWGVLGRGRQGGSGAADHAAPAEVQQAASSSSAPAAPQLTEHKIRVRPGVNIIEVLTGHGFSRAEANALYEQSRSVYDLRFLKAGQDLRLFAGLDGQIERLEYDIGDVQYLAVERRGERFEAALRERPVSTEVREIWGSIEESLILSVNTLGEEDPLALAFADLFGWDVDFYMDLQPGDTFKVIYEKRYIEGRFVGYGNILAAELVNQGKLHRAYYFVPPDTKKPGYYDDAGVSLEKEFRRSPIKFARITSRFSSHRLHPIRKVYTTHYGVDYAAPIGTEVQVTADGTVTFTGWNGGAGRMIRVRHKNNYETMYFHLSRFADGIRPGVRVQGGEVIGYVGSSGESTGPHLDYRILRGGGYLNPLSAKFAPVEPLKPEYLEDYKKCIEKYRALLDDPLVFVSPALI
jgi:murein DD-endopeptidase MepM/ murein hydrolase activator NlpD